MRYGYGRKAYEIVAWTYEADIHCNECALERFGPPTRISASGKELHGTDREGNKIHPVFVVQLGEFDSPVCGTCLEAIE